ncbi:hypothetical protein DSO57_1021748 [Entomophthora muscae]|uniref:Uncharacterized protein n=1 Tax=Entomophthora muscae TaxID=34485 RepID=A0ACC2S5E1_9FUNG|nr:hypothetical protein DSO57_1021748 [Entomophthora muscae]
MGFSSRKFPYAGEVRKKITGKGGRDNYGKCRNRPFLGRRSPRQLHADMFQKSLFPPANTIIHSISLLFH